MTRMILLDYIVKNDLEDNGWVPSLGFSLSDYGVFVDHELYRQARYASMWV